MNHTRIFLFFLLIFFSKVVMAQNFTVSTGHISISMKVKDMGWTADVFTSNNHVSSVFQVSYTLSFELKCGGTKTYSNTISINPGKTDDCGGYTIAIPDVKDCERGIQSVRLVSFSVTEIKKETPSNSTSNASSSSQISSNWNSTPSQSSNQSEPVSTAPSSSNNSYTEKDRAIDAELERQARITRMEIEQKEQRQNQEASQKQANIDKAIEFDRKQQETIKQTNEVVNSVSKGLQDIVMQRAAEREAQYAREDAEREKQYLIDQERYAAKVAFYKKVKNRSDILKEFPAKSIPLSNSPETAKRIYYFIYAYDTSKLSDKYPELVISNVFEIAKSGMSWPYERTIRQEIENLSPYTEIIHGYYYSMEEAEKFRLSFIHLLLNNDVVVVMDLKYKGKPAPNANSNSLETPSNNAQSHDPWESSNQPVKTPEPVKSEEKKYDPWAKP